MRIVAFLLLAVTIILADQFSKFYVMEHILRPEAVQTPSSIPNAAPLPVDRPPASLDNFVQWYQGPAEALGPIQIKIISNFNLVSVWNKGVSFGMFNQASDYGPMLLVGLSVVISLFFLIWLLRNPDYVQSAGIVLVIGGAMGNVIDRLRFGAVFDFLDFHIFDRHWPAFNIADSCIVTGVFVLIFHSFFIEKNQRPHESV